MRRFKQLAAALAIAALASAAGASVAGAESDGQPAGLVLEGEAKELRFEGSEASQKVALSTLGGKEISSEGLAFSGSECTTLEGKVKDTNACHKGTLTFTHAKQGKVLCRSENAKGEKDPIETILTGGEGRLAAEKSTSGVLQPLLVLTVAGIAGEVELTINCGGVKDEVKGKIGCLALPGLKEIVKGEKIEVLCKTKSAGDQETGACEEPKATCEELAKNPLEANLGAGFEMAAKAFHLNVTANNNVFIDD